MSGVSLAIRQSLGDRVRVIGAEPRGAPSLSRGLTAGEPVTIQVTSKVQGLTPLYSGQINIDVCRTTLDAVVLFDDEIAFASQKRLVAGGEVAEPAGAAAAGLVFSDLLPADLLEGRDARNPLRIAAVVSGGNADPAQLEGVRAELAREGATARR